MAVPTVKGVANTVSTTAQATYQITKPSGLADDDAILIILNRPSSAAATAPDASWHLIASHGSTNSTGHRIDVWIKRSIIAANEPSSYAFTGSNRNWAACALALSPISTNDANITWIGGSKSSCGTMPVPSLTAPAESLLISAMTAIGAANPSSYTPGTGITEYADQVSGSTGSSTVSLWQAVGTGSIPQAGPTDSIGFGDWTRDVGDSPTGTTFYHLAVALVDANTNIAPAVVPPASQIVRVGTQVNMTASVSDPDIGNTHSWQWTQELLNSFSSAVTLGGATTATASFTPTVPGTYSFKIIATDNGGLASPPQYTSVIVRPALRTAIKVRSSSQWVAKRLYARSSNSWR